MRGVCVRATAIAPVVALVRSPVSATGCEADTVASNARLVAVREGVLGGVDLAGNLVRTHLVWIEDGA